jgi:hypothetical protein
VTGGYTVQVIVRTLQAHYKTTCSSIKVFLTQSCICGIVNLLTPPCNGANRYFTVSIRTLQPLGNQKTLQLYNVCNVIE